MGFKEVEKLRNEKLTISKKIANVTKKIKIRKKLMPHILNLIEIIN